MSKEKGGWCLRQKNQRMCMDRGVATSKCSASQTVRHVPFPFFDSYPPFLAFGCLDKTSERKINLVIESQSRDLIF